MTEPTTEAGRALLDKSVRERWQVSVLYDQPDLRGAILAIESEARATAPAGPIDPDLLKESMLAAGPIGGVHRIDFQQAFASVHLSQQQLAMEFAEAVAAEYQRRTPEGYRRMPVKRRGDIR